MREQQSKQKKEIKKIKKLLTNSNECVTIVIEREENKNEKYRNESH